MQYATGQESRQNLIVEYLSNAGNNPFQRLQQGNNMEKHPMIQVL